MRALRKSISDLRDEFGSRVNAAKGDEEQNLLAEWSFEAAWPETELAEIETGKLSSQAYRWNIDVPASIEDHRTGYSYIPDAERRKLKRAIRDARRESIRWWVQVLVVPLIALVSSVTALVSLFYRWSELGQ